MRHQLTTHTIALILIVILGACTDTAVTTTTQPATTTTTSSADTSTTETTPDPETDVQTEIDWFVEILNGEGLTADEYEVRFTAEFRAQVPFDAFQAVLDQLRPLAPYAVTDRGEVGNQGDAVVEATDGTRFRILAELDDGRFSGLLVQPADPPTLDDPPGSVEEAFGRLAGMGTVRALAAEVADGACVPIATVDADDPAPLGSVAKLYVLAALGEAVRTGDVSWDDDLVISDELKSIPTGILQDRPDGEMVPVREAAELMISISDNTATDHLVDLLGRDTVEAALAAYGNTTPELSIPFLTTRELTALKVGPASGLSVQWLDGDESARRSILDQIADITPSDLPVLEWVDPAEPHLIEWFASPDDLCALGVLISDLVESVPEVGEILAINPGVPADPSTWDQIWFKGGSEPGLAAAWFVTVAGGRTYVTAGSVVNPDEAFDIEEAILLFAAARDLLAP